MKTVQHIIFPPSLIFIIQQTLPIVIITIGLYLIPFITVKTRKEVFHLNTKVNQCYFWYSAANEMHDSYHKGVTVILATVMIMND